MQNGMKAGHILRFTSGSRVWTCGTAVRRNRSPDVSGSRRRSCSHNNNINSLPWWCVLLALKDAGEAGFLVPSLFVFIGFSLSSQDLHTSSNCYIDVRNRPVWYLWRRDLILCVCVCLPLGEAITHWWFVVLLHSWHWLTLGDILSVTCVFCSSMC